MALIRDRQIDLKDQIRELVHDRRMSDEQIQDLIKDVAKDRARAVDLARLDVRTLSEHSQQMLGQFFARELRGQLPAPLAAALASAQVGPDMLQNLAQRLANAASADTHNRLRQASTPEAARAQALDPSSPQQALRWTQFVQRVQHVPSGELRDRAGSAGPKGEMALLTELLGSRGKLAKGPGLKNPKLVERSLSDLSPGQKAALMKAAFGDKLANALLDQGINDPLSFVKAGALPQGRAELADVLGLDRGKLLALLMRTELLKIGPGNNGELGIRPDLLGPLGQAGIAMLGTLAALRSCSREELTLIYGLLRNAAGGFGHSKASRPPVKRDLLHWARTAGRKPSDILLADSEERRGPLSRGDAQELITAWYLENLFWETLARRRDEIMARERSRQEDEERERGRDEQDDGREPQREREQDGVADFEYDHGRDDKLICFWITDFNTDPSLPDSMRRMYVCIDPDTGAIIPQQLESEIKPSH